MPRALSNHKKELGPWTPIYRSIWRDPQFTCMHHVSQHIYLQFLTQPNILRCGVLQLDVESLAEQSQDLTGEVIEKHVQDLVDRDYLIIHGPWAFARRWYRYNQPSTHNLNHVEPMLKDVESIGRRDLRIRVTDALYQSLSEDVDDSTTFAPDLIKRLQQFGEKWEQPLPSKILHAVRSQRKAP